MCLMLEAHHSFELIIFTPADQSSPKLFFFPFYIFYITIFFPQKQKLNVFISLVVLISVSVFI
jgi:hypothetical protein